MIRLASANSFSVFLKVLFPCCVCARWRLVGLAGDAWIWVSYSLCSLALPSPHFFSFRLKSDPTEKNRMGFFLPKNAPQSYSKARRYKICLVDVWIFFTLEKKKVLRGAKKTFFDFFFVEKSFSRKFSTERCQINTPFAFFPSFSFGRKEGRTLNSYCVFCSTGYFKTILYSILFMGRI